MVKVSIVECKRYNQDEVDAAVKKSLDLIGFKIGNAKKVLLKPNLLGAYKPEEAVTTHPSIIKAVCKILEGCEILIGDSSGIESTTPVAFETSGIMEAAQSCNARIASFSSTKLERHSSENKHLDGILLPKILSEVDLIINLPKLKTHGLTLYTGAMKNIYGCVPGGKKSMLHSFAPSCEEFSKLIVDLNKIVKPSVSIMDAVVGMEGAGPAAGSPKETGLIISSANAAALDYVAAGIIGFNPLDVPMIRIAKEEQPFNVEVIGEKKPVPYEKTALLGIVNYLPRSIIDFVTKKKIVVDPEKCNKCMICAKHCPVGAMEKDQKVGKNCIQCFCCQELCPEHAITLKPNPIFVSYQALKKLLKGKSPF